MVIKNFSYTMRRTNFFPSTFAAFVSVASVTALLYGFRSLSTAARLVPMRCAIWVFVMFFAAISLCIPSAMTFLTAAFSTSSRMPSSSRKSSKLLPMCSFIKSSLWACNFVFALFGKLSVFLRCLLRLLHDCVKENHVRSAHGEEHAGNAVCYMRADFPEVSVHFPHLRKADWLKKFNGLDVASDNLAVIGGKLFEPVADRLVSLRCFVKQNRDFLFHEYDCIKNDTICRA